MGCFELRQWVGIKLSLRLDETWPNVAVRVRVCRLRADRGSSTCLVVSLGRETYPIYRRGHPVLVCLIIADCSTSDAQFVSLPISIQPALSGSLVTAFNWPRFELLVQTFITSWWVPERSLAEGTIIA